MGAILSGQTNRDAKAVTVEVTGVLEDSSLPISRPPRRPAACRRPPVGPHASGTTEVGLELAWTALTSWARTGPASDARLRSVRLALIRTGCDALGWLGLVL